MSFKIKKVDLIRSIGVLISFLLFYTVAILGGIISDVNILVYSATLLTVSWIILLVNKYNLISVPVIFLVGYLMILGLGPIIFYLTGLVYYEYQLITYLSAMLMFYLGYGLWGKVAWSRMNFPSRVPKYSNHSNRIIGVYQIVYLIGLSATILYLFKNRFYLFSGSLNDGRISSLSGNGMLVYLGKLLWLGVYICFEEYLRTNKNRKVIFGMIICASILSAFSGFRSAVMDALIVLIVMRNKKKEINKEILIIGISLLIIFAMIYGILRGSTDETSVLSSLYSELRIGSINFNYIYNTFPQKVNYQYGYTYLINFIMLKPGEDPDFTIWLKNVLNLQFQGGGVTPTLIGELYINFGMVGIFIGMLVFGFLMRYMQELYERGQAIFIPSLFIGYIRSFIRGGIANTFIVFIIYIVGYYGVLWFADKYSIKLGHMKISGEK